MFYVIPAFIATVRYSCDTNNVHIAHDEQARRKEKVPTVMNTSTFAVVDIDRLIPAPSMVRYNATLGFASGSMKLSLEYGSSLTKVTLCHRK